MSNDFEHEYLWNVDDRTYYADSPHSISNTDREVFRESPALFEGRVIRKLPEWQMKVTDEMKFGTAFHHVVFGTGQPTIIPPGVLGKNGAKSTNAWRDWAAEHADEIAQGMVVTQAEYDQIQYMAGNIANHKLASLLIFGTGFAWKKVEQAVRWTCADTGMIRRSKIDSLTPDVIGDLKTFGKIPSARNFATRVEDFGYARQAAYYQDATEALGLGRLPFVFVVVQTSPPYSVECFDLGADAGRDTTKLWLDRARLEVQDDLREIANARESGLYVSKTHGNVTTIQAPRWAAYSEEYV